jgi:hypothetical protein
LTGCDPFGIGELKEESKHWRELAQIQSQAAIRAVPGERYLQLIDDLNSGDPQRVTKAQSFLTQLGHFDPRIDWNATVSFGFDEKAPLRADAFFGFSPTRAQVEYFARYAFNPTLVANNIALPQTDGELNAKINSGIDSLLVHMTGSPKSTPSNMTVDLSWPDSILPTASGFPALVDPRIAAARGHQKAVADILKELLKAQYAQKTIPVGGTVLTLPWYPTEAKNMLFVLIPEDDWNKHKADTNLKIQALLHKAGDVGSSYSQTRPISIDSAQFEKNEPVDRPQGLGRVRWAVVDPTHSSISIPDLSPDKIKSLEQLLVQLNQLDKPTSQ